MKTLLKLLLCVTMSGYSLSSQAGIAAGTVVFASGNPIATSANGTERILSRGQFVMKNDSIFTREGVLQIRMTDGGFISLKPNSNLRIDEYVFKREDESTSRQILSLLKGGLRTITGLIGKKYKENYRLKTPVATIGIRGTKFNLVLTTGGLSVYMGEDGAIEINTADGVYYLSAFEVNQLGGSEMVISLLETEGLDGLLLDIQELGFQAQYVQGENTNGSGQSSDVFNGQDNGGGGGGMTYPSYSY